jgi:hypothetical protein
MLKSMTKRAAKKSPTKLSVGSRVKFVFGVDEVTATVIEDRGNVGYKGRRLLRVRLDIDDVAEPIELEIPEVDVKPVAA